MLHTHARLSLCSTSGDAGCCGAARGLMCCRLLLRRPSGAWPAAQAGLSRIRWPKSNAAVPGARRTSTPPGGDTSTPSASKRGNSEVLQGNACTPQLSLFTHTRPSSPCSPTHLPAPPCASRPVPCPAGSCCSCTCGSPSRPPRRRLVAPGGAAAHCRGGWLRAALHDQRAARPPPGHAAARWLPPQRSLAGGGPGRAWGSGEGRWMECGNTARHGRISQLPQSHAHHMLRSSVVWLVPSTSLSTVRTSPANAVATRWHLLSRPVASD